MLLIKNIKQLIQVRPEAPIMLRGKEMAELPVLDNAWMLIENGLIHSFGKMDNCPSNADEVIDATGKLVFPSWCDSHTHIVYAGSRESEFVDKIHGLSYEEIARRGGGILNSAKRLQASSEDELYNQALNRAIEIASYGTGAVEIKSGYGLTVQDELKMLRVINRLRDRSAYIDLIVDGMLPKVVSEGLADFVDVFCDKGFFTVEETDRILSAAKKLGLQAKIHANELDYSGGIQVGVKHDALSVDHLEYTGEEEMEVLLNSNTMPTLLPSTAFFLRIKQPPAREMIQAGLPIALASDYNPGSSPSGKMSFVLSLACINLRMTPEEAINAATINSAYAMGIHASHGSITPGKVANLFITKEISSYAFLPYAFGSNVIETTFLNGKVQNH